jgi:hypothetical protein
VSTDREKQRGSGQTRGCPALQTKRRSSPRQRTWQTHDDGHRTGGGPRRSFAGARAGRERERECSAEGATECGRDPEKGSGAWECGRETRNRGRIHGGLRGRVVRERVVADRRGPQASEGERANGRSAPIGRAHRAERARVRGRGLSPIGGVHLSGYAGARGLAGLSWAEWAKIGFSFSLEF